MPNNIVPKGKEAVDPILRNRHGLKAGEIKQWRKSEIAEHDADDDLFVIIDGKVYDISDFVEEHPGGAAIMKAPGGDISAAFHGPQHPPKAAQIIHEYYVGEVHPDDLKK